MITGARLARLRKGVHFRKPEEACSNPCFCGGASIAQLAKKVRLILARSARNEMPHRRGDWCWRGICCPIAAGVEGGCWCHAAVGQSQGAGQFLHIPSSQLCRRLASRPHAPAFLWPNESAPGRLAPLRCGARPQGAGVFASKQR